MASGVAGCDRAHPDARFDELTAPFSRIARICWPLPGAPGFPWLVRERTVVSSVDHKIIRLGVQVFDMPIAQVAAEVDGMLVAAGYRREAPVEATGGLALYRRADDYLSIHVVAAPASEEPMSGTVYVGLRPRSVADGPCPPREAAGL